MRKLQPKSTYKYIYIYIYIFFFSFFLTIQSKNFSPTSRNFHNNFIKDTPKVSQAFMNNYKDHLPQKNKSLHNNYVSITCPNVNKSDHQYKMQKNKLSLL